MYLAKTPKFVQNLFPNFVWNIPSEEKVLYLSFDDGPIPEVTPWVLSLLKKHEAKASFFCVGENVEKNPEIFNQIIQDGHQIGNHTYNHKNGWATDNLDFFHNVRKCARLVKSDLFRPPYGRLKPKQIQFLQRHYSIVMWDVLSGDFDDQIDNEQCYQNVITKAKSGSIIVFHDSLKAKDKLMNVLPRVLTHFSLKGYKFESISAQAKTQRSFKKMSA